jgi:hypothetical protein
MKHRMIAGTLLVLAALSARGQTTAPSLSIGFETQHDNVSYHFENPSSWDTPFTVPHFFEQRYTFEKRLLVLRARYTAAGTEWETDAAVSPNQTGHGSDFDTFFQPDGDVVVHGGETDVATRSFRAAQSVVAGQWLGARWRAGYAFSRDRSNFPPSLSSTRHTKPPSFETNWSPTRETTICDVHELRIAGTRTSRVSSRTVVEFAVEAAPLTLARLTTLLPDKYPGQPIRFTAKAFGLSSRLSTTWRAGSFAIIFGASVGRTWPYSSASSFRRQQASGDVAFVLGGR